MKKITLLLILFSITFNSFSQNKKVQTGKKIIKTERKSKIPLIQISINSEDSLCKMSESMNKQLLAKDIRLNSKQKEQFGVYVYSAMNPAIDNIDTPTNAKDRKFKIRIRLKFRKSIDEGGYTVYDLEFSACVGKDC